MLILMRHLWGWSVRNLALVQACLLRSPLVLFVIAGGVDVVVYKTCAHANRNDERRKSISLLTKRVS